MRYSKPDVRPCGPTNTISSLMPCGPVANRVPYPLVADGLSAGIPYATPVVGATDFIPCALRPRPLLQSVAHPQAGVHSGYSREPYAFALLAHIPPTYLFRGAFLHTPPTINGNFHSGYSRLTVNLRSARTLILPTHPLARAISQVWQFPLCRYRHGYPRPTRGHSARSNHRAPFYHHAGISSARS